MGKISPDKLNLQTSSLPNAILKKGRSVTILELFFDVVVVVALGGVVEKMEHELYRQTIVPVELVFLASLLFFVLITWRGFTLYSSRYEDGSIRHKLLTLTLILFLSFFTIWIWIIALVKEVEINILLTILNYIGTLGPLATMAGIICYASIAKSNKYERQSLRIQSGGFIFIFLLLLIFFIVFGLVNSRYERIAFSVTLLIGIGIHFIFEYVSKSESRSINIPKHHRIHVQERYSILFIVFLGEMLIQVVKATANSFNENLEASSDFKGYKEILKFICSLIILFSWWWTFKEIYNFSNITSSTRGIQAFGILMLFVYIGTTLSLVGITIWMKENVTNDIGNMIFFTGIMVVGIFTAILSVAISRIQKSQKFIWPKVFKIKLLVQPLLSAFIFGLCFFFITWKYGYFLICSVIALFEMAWFIGLRIYHSKNKQKMSREYESERKRLDDKWNKYVEYHYHHNADIQLHKQYDWKLNELSATFKKLYFKERETSP